MKLGKSNTMRKGHWWFEYILLGKYEGALIHIDFVFPTTKNKVFNFGITIFTLTLFFFELAYLNQKEIDKIEYFGDTFD